MPKARQTCTRCSMRRQKCDRKSPCSRCVQNKEAHLCTTEWINGYNPNIHRKYPRKGSILDARHTTTTLSGAHPIHPRNRNWPGTPTSDPESPPPFRGGDLDGHDGILPHRERSYSTISSIGGTQSQHLDSEQQAANLDFVTFGRSEYTDVSIGRLLSSKDAADFQTKNSVINPSEQAQTSQFDDSGPMTGGFSPAARAVEVYHIRSLLPEKKQVYQMVEYHEKYMMYWSGGIYHGPTFRKTLHEAYRQSNVLDPQNTDWRWTAFLFSILSASIIGSSDTVSSRWGISSTDKIRLAKNWGNATITCLILGDFASNFHVYSVQAILNLHTSLHLVGSAKEFAVYQSAAISIARGLSLHRLGPHPDDNKATGLNSEQKQALVQREIGRRIWYAITSQDWICTTSQGLYNIQPRHFSSIKPGFYDEETMDPITDDIPNIAHHTNHLNDVARLLIRYQDEVQDATDMTTKYTVVLKFDTKMREMAAEKIPKVLSPRTPINPSWPRWVVWVRRLHQISCSHKIIMMHQIFFNKSFKSSKYAYSRWACVDAAKTIISQTSTEREENEPQWWVEQAFLVTSGLTLALDLFHRSSQETEAREDQIWIDKAIKTLQNCPSSSLAIHGVRLINSLLIERLKKLENAQPTRPLSGTTQPFPTDIGPATLLGQASEIDQVQATSIACPLTANDAWAPPSLDIDMVGFEDLKDNLPLEVGFDNNVFLESMLSLADSQLF
ncbi:hypothetical protein CC78DRAFT_506514 [Lojkania enalia]|uniref:Zn(2)-C6 fungal-type domain-containing protein n=1 Tax=Lojkania enalia TaxID=147567 RepID=A0A9P4NDC2_9PLEO|nr:hypothetical protein CC78DRAFT_506514 [Didymosphaeria enalia]